MVRVDLARLATYLCLGAAALGAAVLVGWTFEVAAVTRFVAGRPAMMPTSALAVLLLGLAGAISPAGTEQPRVRQVITGILAVVAAVIGVGVLIEYAAGRDLGFDQLVIDVTEPVAHPGRPAPFTAMAVTLIAAALLAGRWRASTVRPAEWLLGGGAFLAFVSLVAHVYGASAIYELPGAPGTGVSIPTAIALLLICVGAVLRLPAGALLSLLTSAGPGRLLFTRLGALAVVGTPILGVAAHRVLLESGIADLSLTLALLTSTVAGVALGVIAATARTIDRAHRVLETSREQARVFIEDSADGFFLADLEGRYTFVNAAGCEMLGCRREDIIGKTILDLIPASEASRLAESKSQLLAGRTHTAEWHLRRHDGTYVPVEVSAKIFADGRWQGLVRDITRRKAAEDAARRSEARLEGIISISADAIISIDRNQRVVMYNQGAERIFGWPAADVIGGPLDMLIPDRFVAAHREHVCRFASEETSSRMMNHRAPIVGRRRNGEEFPAEAAISRLSIDGESTFTVDLRDITDSVRLHEELRAALERLQAATRLKDEMLNVVAHDLRSPLSAALVSASLLVRQVPEERREASRRASEAIDRSIRRAMRLVDDLLDVARIDRGTLELRLNPVTPEALIGDAVAGVQPLAAQASIRLDCELEPGLPRVVADKDRIGQVFGNLLDNALKFTAAGGRIRVLATRSGDRVRFAVVDTGRGIALADMPHVFDRFWQSRESKFTGAGLGLAIAKGIVEAHGGQIGVHSAPGAGSTFAFTLPVENSWRVSLPGTSPGEEEEACSRR
jgi:PAS domain S-box-containing protein